MFILSNNYENRVKTYCEPLGVEYFPMALKPSTKVLRTILKNNKLKKKEMIIIGDQFVTDILVGKRFKIKTAFVEPIKDKDLKVTAVNRFIEKIIINSLEKKDKFIRGRYYG